MNTGMYLLYYLHLLVIWFSSWTTCSFSDLLDIVGELDCLLQLLQIALVVRVLLILNSTCAFHVLCAHTCHVVIVWAFGHYSKKSEGWFQGSDCDAWVKWCHVSHADAQGASILSCFAWSCATLSKPGVVVCCLRLEDVKKQGNATHSGLFCRPTKAEGWFFPSSAYARQMPVPCVSCAK